MKTKIVDLDANDIVMDQRTRDWCKLPYPGHPKGCPNYGNRDTCPPEASLFEEVVNPPFRLVGVRFNLEGWTNKMKKKHPKWSDRQARCCLYWQSKVRKRLREVCERLTGSRDIILYTPEAMGVHVFETCHRVSIKLERNPQKFVWKVAIIGRRINEKES